MRSLTLLPLAAAVLALPLLVPDAAEKIGAPMPEFDAVKWYNTVPLLAADLENKAVLIEVFRTW
jgi:hypothetical protein